MAKKIKKTRNQIRKDNYDKLRAAGFSSQEANNLKGSKQEKIKAAVKEKRAETRKEIQRETYKKAKEMGYTSKEAAQIRKFGKAKREIISAAKVDDKSRGDLLEYLKSFTSFIKIPNFVSIEEYQKHYLEPYSYVIKYLRKDGTHDYITITSLERLNPRELSNLIREYIDRGIAHNDEKYTAVPIIKKSAFCEAAVVNVHAGGIL